jgi:hydroxymethylpyrimidine/phosphomethylpyrimidine kinase
VTPPVALTIAGSDSGGGAGIQADLRTFAAHGVHGASAIAALTAQNTVEVRGVLATPASFLVDQIEAVLADLAVVAVKTGMLATTANVEAVADLARSGRLPNLVVDPVMVSSSGHRLLDGDAEVAYRRGLLPHAEVATPNCREAAVLLGGRPIATRHDQRHAARQLASLGPRVVVVKGGDLVDPDDPDTAVDVVAHDGTLDELSGPRVPTANNHGTGCSFASAVAAELALGREPLEAVHHAKAFVAGAIARAAGWHLGAGHGPIDHLGWGDLPAG